MNTSFSPIARKLAATALLWLCLPVSKPLAWTVTPQDVSFVNQQGIMITGKLFKPTADGLYPAIVMLHGCSGIFSNSDASSGKIANLYREWGDRLVGAGYVALLVDSYTPRGAQQNQCGNGDAGVSEVSDRPADAYAALDFLADQSFADNTNIGLLGWSNGGSATLATMSDTAFSPNLPVFKAAIAFYPGCGLYNAFGGLAGSMYVPYAPLRLLHGTQDALYQAGACQTRITRAQLLGASAANGNPMDMIVYQGAKHSFDSALMVGGSQNFTTADVNAKIAADAETMAYFDDYLQ